ncbi:MAG: ATP-binding protein [Oliverpabstia sp.]|nr:ATP-binding protein [Oliverpabstia sp.]
MNRVEMKMLNLLQGGLARYEEEKGNFCFYHCPDRVKVLLGYKVSYFDEHFMDDALGLLRDDDRPKVEAAIESAKEKHMGIKIYSPVKEKNNNGKWFEMVCWEEGEDYYLLLSGMSQETQLFQCIADENADNIYVIGKENYELLYANDLKHALWNEEGTEAAKCYEYIYGRTQPCAHCTLNNHKIQDIPQETSFEEEGRCFTTHFKEIEWNGTPAYVKYVRDITEEVKVKREKERLEKYFETVLKYLPGGVAVVHHELNGALTPEYLSDGFAEMVNMPMEEAWEMYKSNALSGVHPDDREYVKQNLDRCIREKCEREALQYRLKTGTGDYIWVNTKFSVIQCEGGDAMVYADYHDITEEKEMQEKLRQQYRDQIFQHYLVSDANTLILGHCNITKNRIIEIEDRTNSQLLERFGYVREDFFRGIGTLVVDEKERQQFYERYLNEPSARAFENGVTEVLMPCYVNLPNNAEGRYVLFKVNLVETPDTGDITGILTVTDITEKTIQEKIIKVLSSLNYDLVVDVDLLHDRYEVVSGGDINIEDTQGRQSARVRRVVEELVIDTEKEYVKEMLDPVKMQERLKKKDSYSFRYSIKTGDDTILTKNMLVCAIDLRMGRIGLVRTDVTDMLAAERKVKYDLERALSEAEKASRVKSEFLSSMSHDIRTPMNAIVGMTALASANVSNPEKIQDYLKKISVSSQHLLSLINDILDMSQIEQSKIHMNLQLLHMDEVIDQIFSIMTSQAKEKSLQFVVEKEGITHPCFRGDMLRIKQILINLLSNAFKFTAEGGKVVFRTEEIPANSNRNVRYCFVVSDTGIGMTPEFMKHLFEPFCRSEKVNKVEGTGLGLSITKGLVDLMNGKIQVESQVNQGTTFRIELEFEQVEERIDHITGVKESMQEESLEGRHFLLVEDNMINSEILGELLQMRGATYVLKENGQEAVEEFKNTSPGTYDAILMDIQMPIMNGHDATREIRKLSRPDAKTIVIVAMTANAFAEDVQKALSAGMNGHVAKPVDMKLLCNTLAGLMDR